MRNYTLPIALILIILTTAIDAKAQFKGKDLDTAAYMHVHAGHYITMQGGYGLQTITHNLNVVDGSTDHGWGPSLKFGYRWYFSKYIGLGTGLHYQRFSSTTTINHHDELQMEAYDIVGRPIQSRVLFHNYMENAQTNTFSVPATLYWHQNLSNFWKIGLGAGMMYSLSLADKYKYAGNNPDDSYLRATAWYQEIGLEYYGRYTGNKLYGFSDNYKFKSTLSAMAELEIIYSLNIRLDIMAAIYGTYGITAVSSHGKLNLYDPQWNEQDWGSGIEHGNPDAIPTGEYAGLLNTGLTSKSHTASVGLMAGIRYRIGREARLEFEQHSQARHLHQTKQANMMNQSTHQFDKKKRKHFDNDETDSTLLSEEERRKRRIQQMEMERQQRIKDSLAALVVDTAQTQPAANDTPVPPKPDNSWSKELDDIINRINGNNQCAFNEESAAQNKKQRLDIDRLAEILTQHPEVQLDLYGHTCDIGTLEQNKLVGQRRADNFAQQLMDRGVSRKQLHCGTKWWKEPLVPNTSEANRKKNRRVEIIRR